MGFVLKDERLNSGKKLTPEEYLAYDDGLVYRCELLGGMVMDMGGGSPEHSQIAMNIGAAIKAELRHQPFRVYGSNLKIEIKGDWSYFYPDVTVVKTPINRSRLRDDIITNPVLIVEVLSPSTHTYDRTSKFEKYKAIPSFEGYLMVDQRRVAVTLKVKNKNGQWKTTKFSALHEVVPLESIGINLPISHIYEDVEFREK